jgi:hypothetical protein
MRIVLVLLTTSLASVASAQPALRSPRNANYTIDATLDAAAHTIIGSGTDRVAQHHDADGHRSAVPPTGTREHDRTTFMRERALAFGGGNGARPRPIDRAST